MTAKKQAAKGNGAAEAPSPAQRATVQRSPAQIEADRNRQLQEAWTKCASLAGAPNILDDVARTVGRLGLVGDARVAKLIFLVLVSRFLERPLCGVLKGPSSAGKSWAVETTLKLFPASATVQLSSMSEKALVYLPDDIKHKVLVIAEASGLRPGNGAYLLRSLISEGHLRHATVDTADGLQGKTIEREGPTGLLVTTTATKLDHELETRLFSIPIDDSSQQTARIMRAMGKRAAGNADTKPIDLSRWHALQEWLSLSEHRVVVPFAGALAALIPAKAVRLRRDFGALIALVQTNAILHQANRSKDRDGRIIATPDDYAAVFPLVADLISEGVEASVPPTVRETVSAVKRLKSKHPTGVPLQALATELGLDKSSASRRVSDATEQGYLRNEEEHLGRPARLLVGEPLPGDEGELLPRPHVLFDKRCSVVRCNGERAKAASGPRSQAKSNPPRKRAA